MSGVLLALALEWRHAAGQATCILDAADQLVLCGGPLAGWVVAATLAAGLLLTVGAVALGSRAD